ncbi:hypothetical protein BDF14DRAFT_1885102 [Spinellus fusiger]|nr:hypothetical protein BDF14DRAFT_1885102 [Spinellus fusiger]
MSHYSQESNVSNDTPLQRTGHRIPAISPRPPNPFQPTHGLVSPGPFIHYSQAHYYYPTYDFMAYPRPDILTKGIQYHIPHSPVVVQLPIHHTLENATITYDTVEQQKDLVKDVFFSPAIDEDPSPNVSVSWVSPVSSCNSQSDSESDIASVSTPPSQSIDAFPAPTDLFMDTHDTETLLLFGPDLGEVVVEEKASYSPTKRHSSDAAYIHTKGSAAIKKQRTWKTAPSSSHCDDSSTDEFDASAEESLEEEDDLSDSEEWTPSTHSTLFQQLTKANIDWCRYCGTTEGVNWRPGPWGKRTLCNKHGCDYKGYGFACKLPRLDLAGFATESIHDRDRPVLQLFCTGCHHKESWKDNLLMQCEGCPKAYHQHCYSTHSPSNAYANTADSNTPWFCDPSCCENMHRKRIIVELPRKRLPLMCAPKANQVSSTAIAMEGTRTRSLRDAR